MAMPTCRISPTKRFPNDDELFPLLEALRFSVSRTSAAATLI